MTTVYRPADRNLLLVAHIGLMAAVVGTMIFVAIGWAARLLLLALLLAPLAASLKGILKGQRSSLAWLSLALVGYCGLGMVEVIATQSVASVAVLLFALVELALVLRLLRFLPSQSPGATGES